MKNIKMLIVVLVCLIIIDVKADMGAPSVISHKAVVTNKNGAICYNNGKKTDKVIPYGTTIEVFEDVTSSGYIYISYNDESCDVKSGDISAKNQNFSINNEEVYKLDPPIKAIILAKGGLNMRKGPAVTYGRIMTIPQNATIKLTHSAGTYWYYATYNGKSGWVTGMDGYLGFDSDEVLINHKAVKIYSTNGKTVLGTIPANTEIDEYIILSGYSNFNYYVIYNGIKGYINDMYYQIKENGKIKLTKDYTIYDENGKESKKLTANQELEYTMKSGANGFYVPAKNTTLYLGNDEFRYVKEAEVKVKTKGYIGEGLFGETKTIKEEVSKEVSKEEEKEEKPIIPEEKKDYTNIIIIGLLAGIFAALTALVIIKLVNSKKKEVVIKDKPIEKPKEESAFEKVSDKEIAKAREQIIKEMHREEKEVHNKEE